jgi:hypothetical protein
MIRRFLQALAILALILGCSHDLGDTNCCGGHGGVVMCYRGIMDSHGHLLCKDGYQCSTECY